MMKTITILSLLLFSMSSSLFVSCEKKKDGRSSRTSPAESATSIDTPDELTDEMIDLMNRTLSILTSVTDKESATEAKNKMDDIAYDLEALAERFKKLDDPSAEEKERLKKKMRSAQKELEGKMGHHFADMQKNTEVMEVLQPIMVKFGKRVEKLDPIFKRFGAD